jgi:hypothetical protein
MSTADTVATLAKGALWRVTGSNRLAASLINTATVGDEDSSTVAAIMLTKGGERAIGPVAAAIAGGNARLVGVLVSIGTDEARSALMRLTTSSDSDVAEAARRGVERIDRTRSHIERAG